MGLRGSWGRARARARTWASEAEPPDWFALAVIAGGVFGLATLLRREPGGILGLTIAPASDTYLESLIGILITIVGFVIVGFVFIYEQQRRSWRIAFRIRDEHRSALVRGAAMSLVLLLVSIWSSLFALIQYEGDDLMLVLTWPAALASATGFAGVTGAIVTSVLVVQMLSSRRLALRIIAAPDRISSRDDFEEAVNPSRYLFELAMAEHRNEDDEEFRSRLLALERYGCEAVSLTEAQQAVLALLDIALLVVSRRDRALSAIKAANKIAGERDFAAGDLEAEDERNAADDRLRKTLSLLERNLRSDYPSASLTEQILELGTSLHPDSTQQRRLFEVAIRRTVFRLEPSDLWPVVGAAVEKRLTVQEAVGGSSAAAGVIDLLQGLDPARIGRDEIDDEAAREAIARVMPVLNKIDLPEDADPSVLHHASISRLHQQLLALLGPATAAEEGERGAADPRTLQLLRSLAKRGQHFKNYDWLDAQLSDRHRTSIILLGECYKALKDERLRVALKTGNPIPHEEKSRLSSFGSQISSDPTIAAEAIEFALGSLPRRSEKRAAAAVLRLLIWPNQKSRGVVGLTSFVLLRDAAATLQKANDADPDDADIGSLQEYATMIEPSQGFFAPGLVHCAERARELLLDATSHLAQVRAHQLQAPSPDDPQEAEVDDAEAQSSATAAAASDSVAVIAQLALLLGAGLASHLDGAQGLRVFAAVSRAVSWVPVRTSMPMASTTATQMLLDGLTLSTIAFDLAETREASVEPEDADLAATSIDIPRLLDVTNGLQRLRLACTQSNGDETTVMEPEGDGDGVSEVFMETLREFSDAQDALVERLTEPVARTMVVQMSRRERQQRDLKQQLPWNAFPEWAWSVVEEILEANGSTQLDAYRTLTMVAALREEAAAKGDPLAGLTNLLAGISRHPGLPDFAGSKLSALLADDLATQGDVAAAQAMLDAARAQGHFDIVLRRDFIRLASERRAGPSAALRYVRNLCQEPDPRKIFGVVESSVHWMRAVDAKIRVRDCLRLLVRTFRAPRGRSSTEGLESASLAVLAIRGGNLTRDFGDLVSRRDLAKLATVTEAQIAGFEREKRRSDLVIGLDPVGNEVRLAALHIVMLEILSRNGEQIGKGAAEAHENSAKSEILKLNGSLQKRLALSLEAVSTRHEH